MGDTFPKFKAAAVQAAPVFLNREATLDKACSLIAKVADTEENRRAMAGPCMNFTGIFAPGGRLCSDTVAPGEEGIVYAECDIEAIIAPKMRHDVAGHYNRSDVLTLNLNRTPLQPLVECVGEQNSPPVRQTSAAPVSEATSIASPQSETAAGNKPHR